MASVWVQRTLGISRLVFGAAFAAAAGAFAIADPYPLLRWSTATILLFLSLKAWFLLAWGVRLLHGTSLPLGHNHIRTLGRGYCLITGGCLLAAATGEGVHWLLIAFMSGNLAMLFLFLGPRSGLSFGAPQLDGASNNLIEPTPKDGAAHEER
jgi:hypothetical protein